MLGYQRHLSRNLYHIITTMEDFLEEGYVLPKAKSNYFNESKLKDKESVVIRILCSPIVGREDREAKEGKEFGSPVRTKEPKEPLNQVADKYSSSGYKYPQEFWAMKVWNYETEQVQVRSTTRTTVKEAILNFKDSKMRGNPLWYDIEVKRQGEKKETKYILTPWNKGTLDPEVAEKYLSTPCDLDALWIGADPFEAKF